MAKRAKASGISLSSNDAAIIKGMLVRGDRQHDIAAYFGVNGGRIAEISSGEKFGHVVAAADRDLPEPGPYLSGREAAQLLASLAMARNALAAAEAAAQSVRRQ